ncbi:MAG: hypothetical protein CMI02_10965 [Oceanospirillaceae bacterium]|nr:hypothetical protein [Oceanospirillaceae bacterium]MBT12541.1 hypothetical protein [Oceanospirillaceae bacterium]
MVAVAYLWAASSPAPERRSAQRIRYPAVQHGVINKSLYLALGINMDGHKELPGLWLVETEGGKSGPCYTPLHLLTKRYLKTETGLQHLSSLTGGR